MVPAETSYVVLEVGTFAGPSDPGIRLLVLPATYTARVVDVPCIHPRYHNYWPLLNATASKIKTVCLNAMPLVVSHCSKAHVYFVFENADRFFPPIKSLNIPLHLNRYPGAHNALHEVAAAHASSPTKAARGHDFHRKFLVDSSTGGSTLRKPSETAQWSPSQTTSQPTARERLGVLNSVDSRSDVSSWTKLSPGIRQSIGMRDVDRDLEMQELKERDQSRQQGHV